jgi:trimeric autotransporter adhesin
VKEGHSRSIKKSLKQQQLLEADAKGNHSAWAFLCLFMVAHKTWLDAIYPEDKKERFVMRIGRLPVITSLMLVALLIATGVVSGDPGPNAVEEQGQGNHAHGSFSTVSGGQNNTANGNWSTISGGSENRITTLAWWGTIGGGNANTVGGDLDGSGLFSTIAGGWGNKASGQLSFVGGGGINHSGEGPNNATDNWSTVSGGHNNQAGNANNNLADAEFATVGGGRDNTASGEGSTVSGGFENTAEGEASTVGGGSGNGASAFHSTIAGGSTNQARGNSSTVGGGEDNNADGALSTASGGISNQADGDFSTVPGGENNNANGDYSFAAGRNTQIDEKHHGTFLFADSRDPDFNSRAANEFAVRATGGVRFVSAIRTDGRPRAGVRLDPGDSQWKTLSDRNVKENFVPVDGRDILERLSGIPIETWNYKTQDPSIRHIGPMAQDFHAAFKVGADGKHIGTIDADGVALAAIQGLYDIVQEKDAQIAALQENNRELEGRVLALEKAKGVQTGLLPFSTSVMWMMLAGGLGLVLVTPGLVLGYRRIRKDE